MASDTFLYILILALSISIHAQIFPGQTQRYPSQSIPRGYQPPPQPPLRFDYANTFQPQAPQHHFNGFRGNSNLHPPGVAPPPQQQNTRQNIRFPPVNNVVPVQRLQYPAQQQQYPTQSQLQHPVQQQHQYPVQQIQNPQTNNNNVPRLPPVVPELQKPPIIINTLIQVFLDGKNKSIGDVTLERKIVTDPSQNDRVTLTREFDSKTLTFVEEDGNKEHDQNNLIPIKGTAVTNATDIDSDDLASALEKELDNAIPVILEELDKKEKAKNTPNKESGKTDIVATPPEDDVTIEDLEKLIREGLDELEDGEAKKQLEKEFNEVIHSSLPPPQIQTGSENHEQETTTSLPSKIVTSIVDPQFATATTRSQNKSTSVTPEPTKMMTPINSSAAESKEEAETSMMIEKGQTPEPKEMIVPEKTTVIFVEENIDEKVTVTPQPTDIIVPVKVTTAESVTEPETTPSPATTTIIIPEKTIMESKEESTDTISVSTPATSELEKVNEPLSETSNWPTVATTEANKATTLLPIAPEHCEIPNDESDRTKGDVLFLLDSSTSIGPEQFKKAVKLISQTVLNFNNIGPTGIQVSLVQYNREPFLEFSFRRHNCLSLLLEDINDTQFMDGVSNLGRALEKVMKFAFTQSRGDRPDVENVLILVTDGLSDDEVQHPITLTKQNGTTPIVVSTLQAKKDLLIGLAEDDHNNMFNLTEAVKKSIGERLAQRIKEILESKHSTEKTASSAVATTTPAVSNTSETSHTPLQTEVKPSSVELEVTAAPIIPMLPTKDDSVTVECSNDGITAIFQFPENYAGIIVAKDHSSDPNCVKEVKQVDPTSESNRTVKIEVKTNTCGVNVITSTNPSGIQHSIILNILHNKDIITANDKAFILECFHPEGITNTTLETQLNIEGDLPQTKTISLTVVPPQCKYTLRKDSLNGPIIQYAKIGQVIYHRWECDSENVANSVYGLYVHDCKAINQTKHDFEIINKEGCSTDPTIINEITYADDRLLAFAKSYAFTLTDVATLLFSCKVSLCVRDGDGCEGYSPPVCPASNMSDVLLTRRARHYDDALEAALTSELSTEIVDISDPLTAVRIHQLHLPIALVVLAAVIIGSFFGVLWHCCSSDRGSARLIKSSESQCTFPDDESTTDKSETLSFRSLDFRTGEEHSLDVQEVGSSAQQHSETRHA